MTDSVSTGPAKRSVMVASFFEITESSSIQKRPTLKGCSIHLNTTFEGKNGINVMVGRRLRDSAQNNISCPGVSCFLMLRHSSRNIITGLLHHRPWWSSVFVISSRAQRNPELFALVFVIFLLGRVGCFTLGDLSYTHRCTENIS